MADFTIHRVEESDTEEVMMLLKRNFFIDEPLNKKLGYCKSVDDDCPDLDAYCRSILPGVSFKAVDSEGKIIGVLINGVSSVHFPTDYDQMLENCSSEKFSKILDLLNIREHGAQLRSKYPDDDKLLEVKLAATEASWRNKGVMNRLMVETEKACKELGLRLLRIDTSSQFSAQSAERFGFTCVYKAAFTDIKLAGEPIVVPDPPHVYDRVFIKELF